MTPKTRDLKFENDILIDELSPPARRCFKQITTHIRTAPINAYYQETLRHDILQMLIDAEKQGKTLEDVLGTDYGEFLDNAIAEIPPLTQRERRIRGVRGALLLVYFLTFYWFIVANNHLEHTWPMLPVTVGDLIGSALIILIALSFALFSRVLSRSPMTQLYWGSPQVRNIFFYMVPSLFGDPRLLENLCFFRLSSRGYCGSPDIGAAAPMDRPQKRLRKRKGEHHEQAISQTPP